MGTPLCRSYARWPPRREPGRSAGAHNGPVPMEIVTSATARVTAVTWASRTPSMGCVKSPGQHPARPPLRRWRALLVLTVLAGLFGMHALAPVGITAAHEHSQSMTTAVRVHDHCPGGGDCGGGHVHHADETCASAALGGAPALPALAPDPVAVPDGTPTVRTYAITAPDGGRAPPPSLAELQLLRI